MDLRKEFAAITRFAVDCCTLSLVGISVSFIQSERSRSHLTQFYRVGRDSSSGRIAPAGRLVLKLNWAC